MLSFFLLTEFLFASPNRIVSLNPTLTEILFELDLGDDIVGTTEYSDYPDAAKKIPRVGSYARPQIEKIVELKPTRILTFKEGDPSYVESLKKTKLTLSVFESRSLGDFEIIVNNLAELFNRRAQAQTLIKINKAYWSQVKKINLNKKILIEVDHEPLFVAGSDTFISEGLFKCGLYNVFSDLKGYKQVQQESLNDKKPDIILVLSASGFKASEDYWHSNPLTRTATIRVGDPDTMSRLSPRFSKSIYDFCKGLKGFQQ